jgi:TolB-like protein
MPTKPPCLCAALMLFAVMLQAQQNEFQPVANSLASDIASAGKKAIAVVDFTDLQGNPTDLGRFLSEEFSVAMAKTHKGFQVIDRAHLKAIIAEYKLGSSGLINPATVQKIGQITGADALLTGSMTPFSERVRVAVKVLATDTANIITADDVDLPITSTIAELLKRPAAISDPPSRGSAPTRNPAPGSPPSGNPQPENMVVAQEFQFELLMCRGTANSVTCSFRIKNLGPDTTLAFECGGTGPIMSGAFDNFGNESAADICTIANQRSIPQSVGGVRANTVSGLPIPASLVFTHVSSSASSLSVINVRGWTRDWGGPQYSISFRNVPIVR